MSTTTTVRLILDDQLHAGHSWFREKNENVIYLMAEMKQEATYVTHHIQKLLAFFASMRKFADHLKSEGHRVHYIKVGDPEHPWTLEKIVAHTLNHFKAQKFEHLLPDEYRLDHQLRTLCNSLDIPSEAFDTEHFYTTRTALRNFF